MSIRPEQFPGPRLVSAGQRPTRAKRTSSGSLALVVWTKRKPTPQASNGSGLVTDWSRQFCVRRHDGHDGDQLAQRLERVHPVPGLRAAPDMKVRLQTNTVSGTDG